MSKIKRNEAYMKKVLWEEFEGNKQILILHEFYWCGIITPTEYEEILRTWYRSGEGDPYYFTLACFFLLYLDEELPNDDC